MKAEKGWKALFGLCGFFYERFYKEESHVEEQGIWAVIDFGIHGCM